MCYQVGLQFTAIFSSRTDSMKVISGGVRTNVGFRAGSVRTALRA